MSCLKPKLLQCCVEDRNVEVLDIPALEWAGYGYKWGDRLYEFIGKYDALMALGVAELHMLAVGRSGKKMGPGFETNRLADDRFRLELHTNDLDIDAVMARSKTISLNMPPTRVQHDPMSSCLQKAATLIERYPPPLRAQLYQGLFNSEGNGWQMVESFPWLAVCVFTVESEDASSAQYLVRRGAKLSEIADAAGVPMCFKRFSPKATFRVPELSELLCRHPDVVSHHCPEQIQRQRTWLSTISKASASGSEDFTIWVAINWESLPGLVSNLNDWVRACAIEKVSCSIEADDIEKICNAMLSTRSAESAETLRAWWQGMNGGAEAGRLFNKEMSAQTVIRLSEEWHERAAVTEAADVEFPEPWYKGADVNGYRIEPIETAPDLSRYAYRLHNCATSYAHQIAAGNCFIYVVLQEDIPTAMVELSRPGDRTIISQLTGPCNEVVSDELSDAVCTWFEAA